ncbi:MAG: hypothetical protein KZQ83_00545 [gamma proteobacterium symbiont of Taylorina sp.]|nr:hypothetical protein [gamma proteobacterium symbiont of Taylorina sp.]
MSIIKFPKAKRPTPTEVETIDNDRAHQLLNRFIDCCETWDNKERIDKYWKLKADILIYMLIDRDKGVQV